MFSPCCDKDSKNHSHYYTFISRLLLKGEIIGEHLDQIREVLEKGQEYPKPTSAYEVFDDSGRSLMCV
jgi:hypothetical protein